MKTSIKILGVLQIIGVFAIFLTFVVSFNACEKKEAATSEKEIVKPAHQESIDDEITNVKTVCPEPETVNDHPELISFMASDEHTYFTANYEARLNYHCFHLLEFKKHNNVIAIVIAFADSSGYLVSYDNTENSNRNTIIINDLDENNSFNKLSSNKFGLHKLRSPEHELKVNYSEGEISLDEDDIPKHKPCEGEGACPDICDNFGDCMLCGIGECSRDWICTIACTLNPHMCLAGFAIGCAI